MRAELKKLKQLLAYGGSERITLQAGGLSVPVCALGNEEIITWPLTLPDAGIFRPLASIGPIPAVTKYVTVYIQAYVPPGQDFPVVFDDGVRVLVNDPAADEYYLPGQDYTPARPYVYDITALAPVTTAGGSSFRVFPVYVRWFGNLDWDGVTFPTMTVAGAHTGKARYA